jgi:hypothetical protein
MWQPINCVALSFNGKLLTCKYSFIPVKVFTLHKYAYFVLIPKAIHRTCIYGFAVREISCFQRVGILNYKCLRKNLEANKCDNIRSRPSVLNVFMYGMPWDCWMSGFCPASRIKYRIQLTGKWFCSFQKHSKPE